MVCCRPDVTRIRRIMDMEPSGHPQFPFKTRSAPMSDEKAGSSSHAPPIRSAVSNRTLARPAALNTPQRIDKPLSKKNSSKINRR
jgi:hypothetical protein